MHAMSMTRSVAIRAEPFLLTEADGGGTESTFTIRTCRRLPNRTASQKQAGSVLS